MDNSFRKKQSINDWLNQKRGKAQYRPAPRAAISVSKVIKPFSKKFGKGGSSASTLTKYWPEIVGERWAKISKPVKFTGTHERRTLIISAPGAAATLITSANQTIIERLNAHFGKKYIHRIRVLQTKLRKSDKKTSISKRGLTPNEEYKLAEGLKNIQSNELKLALEKLGRGVISDD